MLWAIYCIDKADTASLRDQHMRSHLDYLDNESHFSFSRGRC
jgi:uncharacterized protein YciI